MIDATFTVKSGAAPKILDFDIETVAAGFADPQWVPQRTTVIAWSWIGKREVKHATRLDGAHGMMAAFLADLREADMVTGHNLLRFDLPVLNADLFRLGFPTLPSLIVQDTMRLHKSKGLKKGQDNLARVLDLPNKKVAMDWADWEDAYQWDALIKGERVSWDGIVERCVKDVRQHKALRKALLAEDRLKPPTRWIP